MLDQGGGHVGAFREGPPAEEADAARPQCHRAGGQEAAAARLPRCPARIGRRRAAAGPGDGLRAVTASAGCLVGRCLAGRWRAVGVPVRRCGPGQGRIGWHDEIGLGGRVPGTRRPRYRRRTGSGLEWRPAPGRADQELQRVASGQGADQGRQRVPQRRVRPGQRRRQADGREDGQPDVAVAQVPHGGDPDSCGEHRQHHEDADDQHGLVVRPERRDGKILDDGRGVVDGCAADGGDGRPLRAADPGHQLAHAERDPGHQQADEYPTPGRGGVRMVSHRVYS